VFTDIALEAGRAAVRRETLGDYSYYVANAPLAGVGGAESAVLSAPMLYEPVPMREEVRRNLTLILGLLALLFAATVTLGVFLAGKIFTPIAALQGGTRKIIEGELEFRLEPGAPDEIGELVESFNTMTAALREARRDLLERQRYLAAVLDNIATGVMATDRDGKIITINPSGERILGVLGAGVVGKRPVSILKSPTADCKPPICTLAAARRASSVRPRILGMTSAARMPRMTTTTINSIRVNPAASFLLTVVIIKTPPVE